MRPILIGPVAAGKSTLLPLVAQRLGLATVDLDALAQHYYAEVRDGRESSRGLGWWEPGHVHAVRRVLAEHLDHVVALGAGHTVYQDAGLFSAVAALLAAEFPILVLPSRDPAKSVEVLRSRSLAIHGHDWIRDGTDHIDAWVRSDQNRALARHTVHTEDGSPDEVADEITAVFRSLG